MISQRASGFSALLTIGQIVLASLLFWLLVIGFNAYYRGGLVSEERYFLYWLLAAGGLALEALSRRQQNAQFRDEFMRLHLRSLRQVAYAALPILLFLVFAKDRGLSRTFLLTFLPLLYCVLVASGAWLPGVLGRTLFRGQRVERTLLLGTPLRVEALRGWLERKAFFGVEVVGLVTDASLDQGESSYQTSFPTVGEVGRLEQLISEHSINQVICTAMPVGPEAVKQHLGHIETCERLGVRLLTVSDLEDTWGRPLSHVDDDGVRLIAMREEPLENPVNLFIKRTIDIAISLPVIVFILPPAALAVWLAQRLQSPGPLFHWQVRAGFQNRRFHILKFRTMRVDHGETARQATQHDDRIYPAARFFRKWSVDELPQFWNVLRGDMSLVGPRPHLVEHNELFAQQLAHYQVRTFVKPGITGLAQVRGFRGEARDARDIANRVQSDIEYLENWRLSLEVGIILRTVLHLIFPPKTAY